MDCAYVATENHRVFLCALHPAKRVTGRKGHHMEDTQNDPVNRPMHYTAHPSGIECIQITEHMGFNLGNALKYIWRCDLKQDAIEDLKKAKWYIEREIAKRTSVKVDPLPA